MSGPILTEMSGPTMRTLMADYALVNNDAESSNLFLGNIKNPLAPPSGIGGSVLIGPGVAPNAMYLNDSVIIGSEGGMSLTGTQYTTNPDPEKQDEVFNVGITAVGRRVVALGRFPGNSTAVGDSALHSVETKGSGAFGYVTLQYLTIGRECNSFGRAGSGQLVSGDFVNTFGNAAGQTATSGSRRNLFGYQAAILANTDDDTGMGHMVFWNLRGLDIGGGTFVGENAGFGSYAGFSLVNAYRNTMVGTSSGNHAMQKIDAAGSIAVGNNSYTTKDYQAVFGSVSITETLLRGNVIWNPASAITLTENGTMTMQLTSNTTATLKVRGSDGTTRSIDFTLAP